MVTDMQSKSGGPGNSRRSSAEIGSLRKAPVGRPVMHDVPIGKTDKDALRKERTRLAQRVYRKRRETAFDTLKAKLERVELILEKTIQSFTQFQNFAIESQGLPLNVALALSKTALEITKHSNEARTARINGKENGDGVQNAVFFQCSSNESDVGKKNGNKIDDQMEKYATMPTVDAFAQSSEASSAQRSLDVSGISNISHSPSYCQTENSIPLQPSTTLFPWTYSHRNLNFAQRLRLACVERGFQLLSSPDTSLPEIHPALSLHLKRMNVQELRTMIEQSLYGPPQLNAYGPTHPALIHPSMYRTVEGSEIALATRTPNRDVESFIFGRTRTLVKTTLPGFEGEWLEPIDVQEYLEDKGFRVGSTELANTHIQNMTSMFSPTSSDPSLPNSEVEAFLARGNSEVVTAGYPTMPELLAIQEEKEADNGIFACHIPSQPLMANAATLTYFERTLNLEQLIEYLALSAICIGPGPGMRRADVDMALNNSIAGY